MARPTKRTGRAGQQPPLGLAGPRAAWRGMRAFCIACFDFHFGRGATDRAAQDRRIPNEKNGRPIQIRNQPLSNPAPFLRAAEEQNHSLAVDGLKAAAAGPSGADILRSR